MMILVKKILGMVNACNSDLFFNFQILFLYFVYNF